MACQSDVEYLKMAKKRFQGKAVYGWAQLFLEMVIVLFVFIFLFGMRLSSYVVSDPLNFPYFGTCEEVEEKEMFMFRIA